MEDHDTTQTIMELILLYIFVDPRLNISNFEECQTPFEELLRQKPCEFTIVKPF